MEQIKLALAQSKTRVPFEVKLKTVEHILDLMRRRDDFGMFVIIGWNEKKWGKKYADTPDASQNIFGRRRVNVMQMTTPREGESHIEHTIHFDGAILISSNGDILRSGAMIEEVSPSAVATKINPHRTGDMSTRLGFHLKVHTRHLIAIASSFVLKDTTVVTVSQESTILHVFEKGRIIYSSAFGE